MVITVAISTFVSRIECVPISNGETVPDDGESIKKMCVIVCPSENEKKISISQSIYNLFSQERERENNRYINKRTETYMISIFQFQM